MSLLSLCVLLFQQDLRGVDVQWFQVNFFTDLAKNCQCYWLMVSWSALRTLASSFVFPEKFVFDKGKIVPTAQPNLVPPQRIDDHVETHILHQGLCDLQNFPLWARTTVPMRLLKEPLVIFVLKQKSKFRSFGKSVKMFSLLSATFCSRLLWQFIRRTGSIWMFWNTFINQSIQSILELL